MRLLDNILQVIRLFNNILQVIRLLDNILQVIRLLNDILQGKDQLENAGVSRNDIYITRNLHRRLYHAL